MFSRIVAKYRRLIQEQPERTSPLKTFPVRGWVIVVFMMCLGMALKIIGVKILINTVLLYNKHLTPDSEEFIQFIGC